MPPKKSEAAPAKKSSTAAGHSYMDMIKDAIINLKERNGSSRVALKKYVKANNTNINATDRMFDSLFNKALKSGVEKGEFNQPKGSSGGTKLAKKEPKPAAKPAAAKPVAAKPKAAPVKKAAAPKEKKVAAAAPKKAAAAKSKPAAATKKAAAPKEKKAAAPKAKKPAAKKVAPAVEEKPTILGKTKSGRVTKTTSKTPVVKKAAPKKAVAKKASASA